MTLGDWDVEATKMDREELNLRISALETLLGWATFKREFKGFGMFTLLDTLRFELQKRNKQLADSFGE